jgi:hypothetical protein
VRARILTWQKLIGVSAGVFGAAVAVSFGAELSVANSLRAYTVDRPAQFMASVCGCLFLFLAFPLYTGREWARRGLLLTTYCITGAIAVSFFLYVYHQSRSSSVHPGVRFVIGVCALVALLTPPAFVLTVLHHADVRRAFQAKNASNQSLEPTADRRESHFR